MKRLIAALVTGLALLWPAPGYAQGTLIPWVGQQFFLADGTECNGCLLDTWAAGTTTALATYSNSTLTTPNANPVVMDSAGRPTTGAIYLSAVSYAFRLRTSAGATLWTLDPVTAIPTASGNADFTCTAGVAIAAGELAYVSDGSGSLTAGRCYLADADLYYGSIHPVLGFAPTAIASGAAGTIRKAGTITGLSGLTAGTTYYVSGTAGGVTGTAPANARAVGQALSTTTMALNIASAWILDAGQNLDTMDGRLTLTTAVPVTTADVTAAGTIYYTPYTGNRVTLFDGSRWKAYSFTQLSLALTCTASNSYDVWLYDNAGTLTLETLIWTNATTRATALVSQDGALSKTGVLTRRYVGSFYCTATNQTEDSLAKRDVCNYYNRVMRPMAVFDGTDSWSYSTDTFRQAGAVATNQIELMNCFNEDQVEAHINAGAGNDTGGAVSARVAVGLDSTTTPATNFQSGRTELLTAAQDLEIHASWRGFTGVGKHTLVWLERVTATGTTTWTGDNGNTGAQQTGITGWVSQ